MLVNRCRWAEAHPLLLAYHDAEWGVLSRQRRHLFEFLVLEGAQAGLSWLTILKRREAYRQAFADFDPDAVASWDETQVDELLRNDALIRNRAKMVSALGNARAFVRVEQEYGGFDRYLDEIIGETPIIHRFESDDQVPACDASSEALSRDLKRRGFRFVGPTICYSFLQSVGRVMDHVTSCYRHDELAKASDC